MRIQLWCCFRFMGWDGSKFLPEVFSSWQPINNFMQPTHHRMPDDIDNCYFWRDETHWIFRFCRFASERIWDLSNLQKFNEPSIILKFMYHVYQTLVHISNKHKDKLLESLDPYDYKLEDFHFYNERIRWNLIKQQGKNINKHWHCFLWRSLESPLLRLIIYTLDAL